MDGRSVSRLLGRWLRISTVPKAEDTVLCCDENCRVSTVLQASPRCHQATPCPLSVVYSDPYRGIHTRYAVGRIEMPGPIKPLFVHATREAKLPSKRPKREWWVGGGAVGRKTGPGGPPDIVSGSPVRFPVKESAKQIDRPRGIDETIESCSLLDTRCVHDRSIGALTVTDWSVGGEVGFSQQRCSVE